MAGRQLAGRNRKDELFGVHVFENLLLGSGMLVAFFVDDMHTMLLRFGWPARPASVPERNRPGRKTMAKTKFPASFLRYKRCGSLPCCLALDRQDAKVARLSLSKDLTDLVV